MSDRSCRLDVVVVGGDYGFVGYSIFVVLKNAKLIVSLKLSDSFGSCYNVA